MAALSLFLLGPSNGMFGRPNAPQPVLRRKARSLLAYLAATDQPYRRLALATMFCAEADAPLTVLRLLLSRIRRQLGNAVILAQGDLVQFNRSAAWVDCLEFTRVLEGQLAGQSLEQLEATINLYHGEFLEGASLPNAPEFELWLLGQRARLRHLYERGLAEIMARLIAQEQYEPAVRRTQQLLQSSPLLEEAHAQLIWLYAQTGQREAALKQFDLCRDLLQRELAVEPMPELSRLYAEVLAGRLAAPFKIASPTLTATAVSQATDFVGREEDLARLQRAWQAALDGRGTVVLVAAEAGGGKTRLVQEFARRLPDNSFLVGRCYESTTALPYHPWIEVLETCLLRLDDASLKQLSPFAQDYLVRLLPGLARWSGKNLLLPPPVTGGELEQLFAAIAEFLRLTTEGGRTGAQIPEAHLIFIDDLQWADETSLRLFHFIARRAPQARFLLVGAFRYEEIDHTPALQLLLQDLQRDSLDYLQLATLTPEAIHTLAAGMWPKLPEGYRPHVTTLLSQATGGNPLFVTEVLRELANSPQLPAELPIPASVQELIRRRLRHLPESSRQIVEAMAVLHGPATPAEAQQVSGRSEEETTTAIELGLRRDFLQSHLEAGRIYYDFKHDLIRQAVLGQLSHVRQGLLHRRAATALAQAATRMAPAARQPTAGRITRHAFAGECFELVFQWAPLAADHATSLYAYADALNALEAASDAFDQLQHDPDFDRVVGEQQLIELLLKRAGLNQEIGRTMEEQGQILQRAADLLAQYPDARLQALYYLYQSNYLCVVKGFEEGVEAALLAYEQYRDLKDQQGMVEALYRAGSYKVTMGQNKAGHHYFEQALELCQDGGYMAGEIWCLSGMAWSGLNLGVVESALAYLRQGLALSEREGDRLGQARMNYMLAAAWHHYYDAEKVRHFAETAVQLYQDIGYILTAHRPMLYLAEVHRLVGELDQAQAVIEQVFREADAYDDVWLVGWSAQLLGRLALNRGDLAEAERYLRYALQNRQQSGELSNQASDLAWLGRLLLAQEQPAAALTSTSQSMVVVEKLHGEAYVWEMPDVFLCHAEALTACGDQTEANDYIRRAYESLLQFAAQINDPQVKERFLAHPISARVLSSWRDGRLHKP